MAHASRAWRRGLRSYILLDSPHELSEVNGPAASLHNEVYDWWPNDATYGLMWRALQPADTRAGGRRALARRRGVRGCTALGQDAVQRSE
jgi:hypothetical protein